MATSPQSSRMPSHFEFRKSKKRPADTAAEAPAPAKLVKTDLKLDIKGAAERVKQSSRPSASANTTNKNVFEQRDKTLRAEKKPATPSERPTSDKRAIAGLTRAPAHPRVTQKRDVPPNIISDTKATAKHVGTQRKLKSAMKKSSDASGPRPKKRAKFKEEEPADLDPDDLEPSFPPPMFTPQAPPGYPPEIRDPTDKIQFLEYQVEYLKKHPPEEKIWALEAIIEGLLDDLANNARLKPLLKTAKAEEWKLREACDDRVANERVRFEKRLAEATEAFEKKTSNQTEANSRLQKKYLDLKEEMRALQNSNAELRAQQTDQQEKQNAANTKGQQKMQHLEEKLALSQQQNQHLKEQDALSQQQIEHQETKTALRDAYNAQLKEFIVKAEKQVPTPVRVYKGWDSTFSVEKILAWMKD
ncbi:hypothetical protein CLAFUR0_03769 [Fulvia fulva]|nr:hypothetical protein CLAFUR0_03769 [Fulvia fulva]